jgi:hypothetical protein
MLRQVAGALDARRRLGRQFGDVRITAQFLDAARRELERDTIGGDLAGGPGTLPSARKSHSSPRWMPAFAGWAAAAMLLCVIATARPLQLSVDIPTGEPYASYSCVLVAQSGTAVWSVPVTAEQAKDSVSIVVPTTGLSRGNYTLVVRGYAKPGGAPSAADLAEYHFTLNSSN